MFHDKKDRFSSFLFMALCALAIGMIYFSNVPPAHAYQARGTFSFNPDATTTAARVQESPSLKTFYSELRCWNNSATPVYLGGASAQTYPICTDTAACPESVLTLPVTNVWALSSSGTVGLKCIIIR